MCSGPNRDQIFINASPVSFDHHSAKQDLVTAFRKRAGRADRVARLFALTEWVNRQQIQAACFSPANFDSAPNALIYSSVLGQFHAERGSAIFSGDRMLLAPRIYSSMALTIRALLQFAKGNARVVDASVFSLLLMYLGRLRIDPGLIRTARMTYVSALEIFRSQIARWEARPAPNGSAAVREALLSAAIALQMFEILDGVQPTSHGFLTHFRGTLSLMRSFDSSAPASSQSQELMNGFKTIAVYVGITEMQPRLTTEIAELLHPFTGKSKHPRDRLMDLGLDMLSLMPLTSQVVSAVQHDINLARSLLQRLISMQQSFDEWFASLKLNSYGALYWTRWSPIVAEPTTDAECLPKHMSNLHQLCFPCGPIAGLLVHYWVLRLELVMKVARIRSRIIRVGGEEGLMVEDAQKCLEAELATAEEYGQLILEATPYLSSCFEGVICLQSPLAVVERYFSETRGTNQ